jgi:hypothetical protein
MHVHAFIVRYLPTFFATEGLLPDNRVDLPIIPDMKDETIMVTFECSRRFQKFLRRESL